MESIPKKTDRPAPTILQKDHDQPENNDTMRQLDSDRIAFVNFVYFVSESVLNHQP